MLIGTPPAKRGFLMYGAGGEGSTCLRLLRRALGQERGFVWRFIDTNQPPDVPSNAFLAVPIDELPEDPDPQLAAYLRLSGMSPGQYRRLRQHVGVEGAARIPALSWCALLRAWEVPAAALSDDSRALASDSNGVEDLWLVTVSSLCGGTGNAAARAVGTIARATLQPARWLHVALARSVLPGNIRGRRVEALEHRALLELAETMQPDALLKLPGNHDPIARPGPDHVLLLSSSASEPRTLSEGVDDLVGVLGNLSRA